MIKIKPEVTEKRVTKVIRPTVTKVIKAVTEIMGRPRVHPTGADRQRAYRERKKANA